MGIPLPARWVGKTRGCAPRSPVGRDWIVAGRPTLLTQGAEGSQGSDGAPPGFTIKQGGLGSGAQALALATLCGVLFLTFLDNTVVSVGLANVQSDLHALLLAAPLELEEGDLLNLDPVLEQQAPPYLPARSRRQEA